VQRAATAVSELARNIVSYTPGGRLKLEPIAGTPPRLRIIARDQGPGIPHLPDVLSGKYRSKTGLGRGLRGVKELTASFDIQTGPAGTTVTAEVLL
jgi:serine/threonine-protein kinase RsbT